MNHPTKSFRASPPVGDQYKPRFRGDPGKASGPLSGVRVVELASLAPGPFAATMLSDLGAEVLRVDRVAHLPASPPASPPLDPLGRGRRSVAVDLKNPDGVDVVLRLAARADVLIEGFRPGVTERLGIGPSDCFAANPRLIYGRMTGYGQSGPLAQAAGHDIDYLAIAGALDPIGPSDGPPVPPINYVADFGGGGMLLVVGILAALHERSLSGRGQVVDASMTEGAGLMAAFVRGLRTTGLWPGPRGTNIFDGGAPFYGTYACSDGRFVAVGAVEPQFYAELLRGLGLRADDLPPQHDRDHWPATKARFAEIFATKSRDDWAKTFRNTDACVTPVLTLEEAPKHPHNKARKSFVDVSGTPQPAPAPRLSRTPGAIQGPAPYVGQHTREALVDWGFPEEEIDGLMDINAIG